MKGLWALLTLVLPSMAVSAPHESKPINSGTELRDWCKDESEASLIGKGLSPFNWTASYWDQGNVLMVKGEWRVGDGNVSVECSVARGAESRYANLSISAPPDRQ